jgi:hypothetical protein
MPLEHGRPRMLSEDEIVDLRREMQNASAWMRAELLRRRSPAEVAQQRRSQACPSGSQTHSTGKE